MQTVDSASVNTQASSLVEELQALKSQVTGASIPDDLRAKVDSYLRRLERMVDTGVYSQEYDRISHYIGWVLNLPWSTYTPDKIDIVAAKKVLDSYHYGMEEPKERMLEYLAALKLKRRDKETTQIHAPIICLVGLVGTGKTTFAYSLAEALGRKFVRIPFGGLGSARDLRGRSMLYPEAEPGYVVKALRQAGSKNPVILLDELDRVSEDARADVMGVLVELLDPTQNSRFIDHYVDFPFDLSSVLFISTANNTTNIATAVMDRLEVIQMPSYTDEEKIHIAREFLLPRALKEAGLNAGELEIDPAIWPQVARPLGYDAGIRTLERTIQGIARKAAKQIVEGSIKAVVVNQENLKDYIPSY